MAGAQEGSQPPAFGHPEKRAEQYREMRKARRPGDPVRWILLIKELRVLHGCSILEAEHIALSQPSWRRWVEQQINRDAECAKSARWHIRHYGDAALIEERDGKLALRQHL